MERLRITMLDGRHFSIEVKSMPPEEHAYTTDLIRQLPERKWSARYLCWKVPTTPLNIRYLRTAFRDEECEVDQHARVILEYTELTEATASQREKRRWEYVFNGAVPAYNWNATKAFKPFKHQIVAADASNGAEFFAQLMEQGTGKTGVAIEEMVAMVVKRKKEAAESGKPMLPVRVLVLCPATLRRTWLDELKVWVPDHVSLWSCRMRTRSNGTEDLVVGMRATADLKVWVSNYERVGPSLDALKMMEFDLVVADEASAIKNPSAKRTKAAWSLAESCDKRRILTGTIMANSIFDVFAPFEFLQRGCLGYSSFQHFKDRYGIFSRTKNWEKLEGHQNLDELKERMARHSFIVKKKDCLDLPEKTYQTRAIEMGEVQADLYEQMAVAFIASLESDVDIRRRDPEADLGNTVEAKAVIAQLTRFAQITSGFLATPKGPVRIPDGDAKVQACLDIIEETNGKVIIWCRFREDIRYIVERLNKEGIKSVEIHGGVGDDGRAEAKYKFGEAPDRPHPMNDDEVKVLVGEAGTGGIGLTLLGTKNMPCSTVIYYSADWSLLKRQQSEDRIHRIGQTHICTYYSLVCEGTIDERIDDALRNKRTLSDELKNVASIKDLLLFGRKPKKIEVTPADPVSLRALLSEQGVVVPMEVNSTPGCADFDHDTEAGTNMHRCQFCSGNPLTVPVEILTKWYRSSREESAA